MRRGSYKGSPVVTAPTPLCRASNVKRRRYKGSPVVHASTPLFRSSNMRQRCQKGSPVLHAFTPLCRASTMGRRRYKGSTAIHASIAPCRSSNTRRVRGQRTTDSLLCIFSRTGRHSTRICEVLPKHYTPQWIAARIGPHGEGSLLGDDAWYAVYWDYSDLPSDT